MYNELMVALMCYSLCIALLLLPMVMQTHLNTGILLGGLFLCGVLLTIYALNQVSALTLYGGLVSETKRASTMKPWDFRSRRDDRGVHDQVVDALVRNTVTNHRLPEGVLSAYSAQRVDSVTRRAVETLAAQKIQKASLKHVIAKQGGAKRCSDLVKAAEMAAAGTPAAGAPAAGAAPAGAESAGAAAAAGFAKAAAARRPVSAPGAFTADLSQVSFTSGIAATGEVPDRQIEIIIDNECSRSKADHGERRRRSHSCECHERSHSRERQEHDTRCHASNAAFAYEDI
jgi:hypothetical protein